MKTKSFLIGAFISIFGMVPAFAFAQTVTTTTATATRATILQQLYDELVHILQIIQQMQAAQGQGSTSTTTPVTNAPQIYSIDPTSGAIGDTVTIKGFGFTQDNTIHFGNGIILHVPATGGIAIMCAIGATNCHSGINQSITFTVPSTMDPACASGEHKCLIASKPMVPGVYDITVENTNGTSAPVTFTVTASSTASSATSTPSIYNIQPSSGPVGTQVTIGGNNFGSDATIHFGGGMIAHVVPKAAIFFCPMIPAGSTQTCGSYTQTVTFTVPSSLGAFCTTEICPLYALVVNPGTYQVSVRNNDTGLESTSTAFLVTTGTATQ